MAKVFVIDGKFKGKSVQLMNRYIFVDGVHLEEDDDSAKLKAAVLCKFYPCTMYDHADYLKRKAAGEFDAKNELQSAAEPPKSVSPKTIPSTSTTKPASPV